MKKLLIGASLLLAACSHKMYQPGSMVYNDYRITQTTPQDSNLAKMLKPYADSVNSTMNGVIGTVSESLSKAQPEGSLGNFMTDAMLVMARKNFKEPVDITVVNYGGIRLNQIPAGPITTGKIYELMPFDNLMVLLPIKGDTLQSFLNHVASKGGWPMSGITYTIAGDKATEVLIAGKPISGSTTYHMAISDYVANGGDDCTMLKSIPQINTGFVLRDALLQYVKLQTSEGKNINAKVEGRVKKSS
jgi:2',3'-cyclic-nucleotide 2'-phosphodiesterase (5'-nucleotidase family)